MSMTSDKYSPLKNICVYAYVYLLHKEHLARYMKSCSTCKEAKISPVNTKKMSMYYIEKEYIGFLKFFKILLALFPLNISLKFPHEN